MSGEKKGYGLPFSPPWGGEVSLKYTFLEDGFVSLGTRFAGRQEDIVPPEKPTDGWHYEDFAALIEAVKEKA